LRHSVQSELSQLLADQLEVGLQYEAGPGRLSLSVLHLLPRSFPASADTDLYIKLTLHEGGRVIKAKKTRLLACGEQLEFNEVFSIILPARYLHTVTCSLSLCTRSRIGVKGVRGRAQLGPGTEHWQEAVGGAGAGQLVTRWHALPSTQR